MEPTKKKKTENISEKHIAKMKALVLPDVQNEGEGTKKSLEPVETGSLSTRDRDLPGSYEIDNRKTEKDAKHAEKLEKAVFAHLKENHKNVAGTVVLNVQTWKNPKSEVHAVWERAFSTTLGQHTCLFRNAGFKLENYNNISKNQEKRTGFLLLII